MSAAPSRAIEREAEHQRIRLRRYGRRPLRRLELDQAIAVTSWRHLAPLPAPLPDSERAAA